MFSLTALPVHCCSTVFTDVTSLTSSRTLVTLLAKRHILRNISAGTYACSVTRQRYRSVVKSSTYVQNVRARSLDKQNNLKLPTVLLFVELNNTIALAVLKEQRDFVSAGVGQSCGCEAL